MNDPLAQYRKKPAAGVATEPPPPKAPDEYVAFDAKDKVDRLQIRQANAQARSPAYGYLLDVAYDGPFGTNFVLYYSFMMIVRVEGKNLQPLIMALQMGTAEFIQEFDPEKWPMPKDPKAPFIESIKIAVEQGGPSPEPKDGKTGKEKELGRSLH
jgi:hypothetical protein